MDEIALCLAQHNVDVAVLTETWLRPLGPDSAVSIDSYNLVRLDREDGNGGGIMCYFTPSLAPTIITSREIPSLNNSKTEFLSVF